MAVIWIVFCGYRVQRLSGIEFTNVGYEVPNICELKFSPLRDIGQYTIKILKNKSGGGLIIIERVPGSDSANRSPIRHQKIKGFQTLYFFLSGLMAVLPPPQKKLFESSNPFTYCHESVAHSLQILKYSTPLFNSFSSSKTQAHLLFWQHISIAKSHLVIFNPHF